MNDLLIIRYNYTIGLDTEDLDFLYNELCKQKEKGVILLPPFCEAILVPDDVEIKIGGSDD